MTLKETYLPALSGASRTATKKGNTIITEQMTFDGLCHRPYAGLTDMYDMKNLTPDAHALTVRPERKMIVTAFPEGGTPHGMCHHDGLVVAQGTSLYRVRDGEIVRLGDVSDTDKSFTSFGKKLIIMPDKLCYDAETGELIPMELDSGTFGGTVSGGHIIGSGNWESMGFHVGDGVRLEVGKINVTGYSGPEIAHCRITKFVGRGMYVDHEFTQSGQVNMRMVRECPDMTHVCACGERLVGCNGNAIYISEAGNPFNWCATDPDGVASRDPATVWTASPGEFKGCIPWEGYALLFKEDHICRLIGHGAGTYALDDSPFAGVSDPRSLCRLNGDVYYLSAMGPFRYSGGEPTYIGEKIGVHLTAGCGGTDGRYYYLSANREGSSNCIYIWDPTQSCWYIEENAGVAFMANVGDRLYFQTTWGAIMMEGNAYHPVRDGLSEIETVGKIVATVTFGSDHVSLPAARHLVGLCFAAEAAVDEIANVYVSYDGGTWQTVGSMKGRGVRHTYRFNFAPQKCDEYRLRIDMIGDWRVSRIYRMYRE